MEDLKKTPNLPFPDNNSSYKLFSNFKLCKLLNSQQAFKTSYLSLKKNIPILRKWMSTVQLALPTRKYIHYLNRLPVENWKK
jgi:hypothetical protein